MELCHTQQYIVVPTHPHGITAASTDCFTNLSAQTCVGFVLCVETSPTCSGTANPCVSQTEGTWQSQAAQPTVTKGVPAAGYSHMNMGAHTQRCFFTQAAQVRIPLAPRFPWHCLFPIFSLSVFHSLTRISNFCHLLLPGASLPMLAKSV